MPRPAKHAQDPDYRKLCGLFLMAQASHGLLRYQAALLILVILGLGVVLVIAGVIFAAVFSDKRTRRTAALAVLDRILRWKRLLSWSPGHGAGRDT